MAALPWIWIAVGSVVAMVIGLIIVCILIWYLDSSESEYLEQSQAEETWGDIMFYPWAYSRVDIARTAAQVAYEVIRPETIPDYERAQKAAQHYLNQLKEKTGVEISIDLSGIPEIIAMKQEQFDTRIEQMDWEG